MSSRRRRAWWNLDGWATDGTLWKWLGPEGAEALWMGTNRPAWGLVTKTGAVKRQFPRVRRDAGAVWWELL